MNSNTSKPSDKTRHDFESIGMTERELVLRTLEFRNTTGIVPREIWILPWAFKHYGKELNEFLERYSFDFEGLGDCGYTEQGVERGDRASVGESVDGWGCTFINIHDGVIGEVKEPQVQDDDWLDCDKVHVPEEWLSFSVDKVNAMCADTTKFVRAGTVICPFEQLQFIRGTENLFMDFVTKPSKMLEFKEKMHDFYCRLVTKWCQTDVDGIQINDDWGTQRSLLISPELWKELFMPMYRDYCDIAKKYGKKVFMHSDGYTLDIIPYLIDIGVDALNCQIACMGADNLEQFAGDITFWGEVDRQYILPFGTTEDVERFVRDVRKRLWKDGGCIAQCEFSAGGKPENIARVFEVWDE